MKRQIPPIHPGDILMAEFLKPTHLSQNKIANDLVAPPRQINEIVYGKRRITATLNGVGSLRLSGNTDNFIGTVACARPVEAKELIAKHTDIEPSGAGSTEVYAAQSPNVTISGVGNVSYYGDPESVRKNIADLDRVKEK